MKRFQPIQPIYDQDGYPCAWAVILPKRRTNGLVTNEVAIRYTKRDAERLLKNRQCREDR